MLQRITLPGIIENISLRNIIPLVFLLFIFIFPSHPIHALNSGECGDFSASDKGSVLITINGKFASVCPIVLFIEPVAPICLDANNPLVELAVTIQGNDGSGNGVWSGPGIIDPIAGIFNPNDSTVIDGSNIITYTFIENNCIIVENTIIYVSSPPVIDAGTDNQLSCTDTVLVLNGSASGTNLSINWSGPGIISGAATLSPKVNLPGWYYLTVHNSISTCSNIDSVYVGININVPVASAGPDKTISCIDTTALLLGGGSVGPDFEFIWQGPGINVVNADAQFPEVEIPGNYILKVRRIANNCTSLPDTAIVFDNTQAPEVSITQPIDTVNCKIVNFNLIAFEIDNATYEWFDLLEATPVSLGTDPNIYIENPGIYSYHVLDTLNGCTNQDTIEVHENDAYPYLEVHSPMVLDCKVLEITLDGSNSISGEHIVYSWDGPSPGITGNPNASVTTVNMPGAYTFYLQDTILGCKTDTTIFVQQLDNGPRAVTNLPSFLDCKITESTLDGTASSSMNGHLFEWNFDQMLISDQAVTVVDQAGIYQLIIKDTINECRDTGIVEVIYHDNTLSNASIEVVPNICFGDTKAELKIHGVEGGAEPYFYSLDGGNHYIATGHFGNLAAGDHLLTIKDSYGCTMDTLITIVDPPEIKFSLGEDIHLKLSQRDTVEANINLDYHNIAELSWFPEDLLECVNQDTCFAVTFQPLNNLTIRAILEDTNGCFAEDEIKVFINKEDLIFVPNVFSPNNDGKNDLFMIYGGPEIGMVNQLYVYNRTGETVYEGAKFLPNDPQFGWDGTLKGKELNPAVFVYWAEIELIDGQRVIYKGDITLIR